MSDSVTFATVAAQAHDRLRSEMATVRTGRANPGVLAEVRVEAYGVRVPLQQLATVTVPEPRQMLIQPFDPSTIKDIERGLTEANLGLSVSVDGRAIRVAVPPLTEETRRDLVKVVKQKVEAARVRIRQARDAEREKVIAAERAGELGEDDKFGRLKELDEQTKQWQQKLEALGEQKEADILTV